MVSTEPASKHLACQRTACAPERVVRQRIRPISHGKLVTAPGVTVPRLGASARVDTAWAAAVIRGSPRECEVRS